MGKVVSRDANGAPFFPLLVTCEQGNFILPTQTRLNLGLFEISGGNKVPAALKGHVATISDQQ